MSRLNDPVWQAFEQDPPAGTKPLNAEQIEKRQRGLSQMRAGLFVNVDEEIKKLQP